jgi:hypothetical protein
LILNLILVLQPGRDFVQVPELDLILNLVLVPKIKPGSGWVFTNGIGINDSNWSNQVAIQHQLLL